MKSADFHTTAALAFEQLGRVHFIGLGGAGMSAVARILLARGVPVSGSDARDSQALEQLRRLGAVVQVGHDAANVADADTVVVSTAIRPENPELQAAASAGLTIVHRSVALAASMGSQELIAVAGTHGKTTTTSMITVMLRHAGLQPSFAIGGGVAALGVNADFGEGRYFVAEADESDGSFLNYRPRIAVVTNVEADHLDHYGTAEAVHRSFDGFAALLPADGVLVACLDDPGARALAERVAAPAAPRVVGYGYDPASEVRIGAGGFSSTSSTSTLAFPGGGQALHLQVPGEHNIRNAAAAFAVGLAAGLDPAEAAAGLAEFTGAARRFEAKGEGRGVRVFDDYAHHPTEVAAALQAARKVAGSGGAVHVLFQPHLFSRTREFAAEFADALSLADSVTVLDIYAAREDPVPGVTSELIAGRLSVPGGYEPDPARAVAAVAGRARPGDIILTVGAGDVTQYGPQLVRALEERAAAGRP
ncbi:UDP-N-acetylmuramate--L-alanine ligase [Arthrobacter deserti]|uniref:UDP-N-acetylmuramate--L-alanine ligase n=1 Tax=Arthrobacter deserti TaxID=1742687 RepID=A0ABX1JJQ0_9MICC|nr:UDP-N-acetylmuramate--L-alanine ligase [Arthrobacter deserti]